MTFDLDQVIPVYSNDCWDDEYKPIVKCVTKKELIELAKSMSKDIQYQFLVTEWIDNDDLEQLYLDEWLETN